MEGTVPGGVEPDLRLIDADVRDEDEDVAQYRKGKGWWG
jgi:hypothetical protein